MADSKDDLDEEGFVYEISFQETLQTHTLRAGSEVASRWKKLLEKLKLRWKV